jgi:hypothetical protein
MLRAMLSSTDDLTSRPAAGLKFPSTIRAGAYRKLTCMTII